MSNNIRIKKVALFFSFFFLIDLLNGGFAFEIRVKNTWALTINGTDLQSGPGSDLNGTYESNSSQIELEIRNTTLSWTVDVKKTDSTWHNDFQLFVKRTTDGVGPGSVSGGTTYQEITNTNQQFITGSNELDKIFCQLKLQGVSISIAPAAYSTTVTYTATET